MQIIKEEVLEVGGCWVLEPGPRDGNVGKTVALESPETRRGTVRTKKKKTKGKLEREVGVGADLGLLQDDV